jgi:hypothetical protein
MSEHIIILQGTTPDALATLIADRVKIEVAAIREKQNESDGEILFTRQEAKNFLSVDLSTLHLWGKQGRIPVYKIANRIYFKKSELIQALRPVAVK